MRTEKEVRDKLEQIRKDNENADAIEKLVFRISDRVLSWVLEETKMG